MCAWLIFWIWASHKEPFYNVDYNEPLYAASAAWTWRILNAVARGEKRRGFVLALIKTFLESKQPLAQAIGAARYNAMMHSLRGWREYCYTQ